MTEKTINLEIVDLEERIAPSCVSGLVAEAATAGAGAGVEADLGCAAGDNAGNGAAGQGNRPS
jgi:hypothetical protein